MSEWRPPSDLCLGTSKEHKSSSSPKESTIAESPSCSEGGSSYLSSSFHSDGPPPRVPIPCAAAPECRDELSITSLGQKRSIAPESYQSLIASFLQLCGLPRSRLGSIPLLLFQTLVFLRQCGYDGEEILIVLAYASAYVQSCSCKRSAQELGSDIVLLIFLAHSYVLDKTCPLSYWRKHLFRDDSSMQALNGRVLKLSAARGYVLSVEEKVFNDRFRDLRAVALVTTSRSKAHTRRNGTRGGEGSSKNLETCCVPWRLLMRTHA